MAEQQRLLLKKYPNRRLYDTEKSVYVTLNQVSDMVREGREIQVIDARTEVDVTAFILTQIIVEEAKNQNTLLPVSLLHLVIRYGGNILSDFFQEYLEMTIRNYLLYKNTLDEQFRGWMNLGSDFSTPGKEPPPPFSSLNTLFDIFSPLKNAKKAPGEDKKP